MGANLAQRPRGRRTAGVLEERDINPISCELEASVTMDAGSTRAGSAPRRAPRVQDRRHEDGLAQALMADIEKFKTDNGCAVSSWSGGVDRGLPRR